MTLDVVTRQRTTEKTMGMYGRAAIRAAQMLKTGVPSDPEKAWDRAVARETQSSESRRKSCPRGAFLELCAAGAIPGCRARPSLHRSSNGEYAVQILEALRTDKELVSDKGRLWDVAAGRGKEENGQVDVVVSLWTSGLIR
jgi:hypothetical protein